MMTEAIDVDKSLVAETIRVNTEVDCGFQI